MKSRSKPLAVKPKIYRSYKMRPQYRKVNKEVEQFLVFPVLVALSRRPMSIREMSRTLLIAPRTARRRIRELEALGYVIQRKYDNRFVLIVQLQKAGLPEPTSLPGDEHPTPPKIGPAREVFLSPDRSGPPVPAGDTLLADLALRPKKVLSDPSEGYLGTPTKIAAHFNIPQQLAGMGDVGLGKLEKCQACKRETPIKYGGEAVCGMCAKVWNRVDREGIA